MRRPSRLLTALIATLVLAGCASPSPKPQSTATTTVTTESVAATEPAAVEATVAGNPKKPISEVLKSAPNLSTMTKLIAAAGLTPTFSGKRYNTLFVPTDAAFEKLPDGWLAALQQPANKEKLRTLLRYHMVMGTVPVDQFVNIRTALTYQGGRLKVSSSEDGTVTVNGAKITQADVPASNGNIQVVDAVLLPPGFKP